MSFTVYKSSAGSGKTYTLVKEYLRLALNSFKIDDYKHILAITFTNKAANEMKERVLKALIQIAEKKPEIQELVSTLEEETQLSRTIIEKKAEEVLKHILHHYADFSISTIDKFVYKIIRIFAFDLRLPLNFEVELDSKELLSKAIDELINRVGKDEKLTQTLLKYTEEKADAEKSWHIEDDIEGFAASLLKDEHQVYVEKLKSVSVQGFFDLRIKILKKIKSIEAVISDFGSRAQSIIEVSGVSAAAFSGGKNGIPKYFEYLATVRKDKLTPTNTIQKNVEEDNWYAGKATQSEKIDIDGIKVELAQIYFAAFTYVEENYSEYIELSLLNDNIYGLSVLNEVEKVIDEIKQENNILHISEFNKRIAAIVLNEPAPFIYERIGERYTNYLIDEFQDTSELQWQNLLPLIDNSLASGEFNMVVGDGKQAIYRWRGGEVEQFSMLPYLPPKYTENPVVKEREDSLIRNFNAKNLSKNFRSKKNVVEFNNRFFKELSGQLEVSYQKIYEDIEQEFLPKKQGGYVSFNVFDDKDKDLYTEQNLIAILDKVKLAVQDNYQLCDIAILTRRNKEAIIISDYLLQNNIDIISSESLLVNSSFKVRTIVAALHFLQDNSNVEAKLQLIKHVAAQHNINVNHELLSKIVLDNVGFYAFLKEYDSIIETEKLIKLPLLELISVLAQRLSINPKVDSFVSQFFEFAFKQVNKKAVDIYSFLEEWEAKKQKLSIALSEGANAVSIMTIHKSKGLQFPVVIFPFASWKIDMPGKKHWVNLQKQEFPELKAGLLSHNKTLEQTVHGQKFTEENNKVLLDNINMLYVAFTRPEDRLHVITSNNPQTLSKHYLPILSQFDNWDEEKQELIVGELSPSQIVKKATEQKLYLQDKLPAKAKDEKVEISYQYIDYWNELDGIKGRKYGLTVHHIMSQIYAVADLDKLNDIISLEEHLTHEEKVAVEKYIFELFLNTEIKAFFMINQGDQVFNEREIMLGNGSVARPDRVVIKDEVVTIVDYKTGDKQEKYKKQLHEYENVFSTMGYTSINKYIIYTDTKEVEAV